MASAALSARSRRFVSGSPVPLPPVHIPRPVPPAALSARHGANKIDPWRLIAAPKRHQFGVRASSRADDSPPFDMSVENALKVLGVPDGASFDEILRARNSILASRKDDLETIAQVEAAYDMLLMQSLTQRRAGKVVNSGIRYADVNPRIVPGYKSMPQWVQARLKSPPVSIEKPSTGELGLQSGVYGSLIVLAYLNGASSSPGMPLAGPDVPGLIVASGFGASLYFMNKRNVKLGKATAITVGGLVAGAAIGSAVENWLQVDIVPFLGIHSPAALISEFILFSQLFASLFVR